MPIGGAVITVRPEKKTEVLSELAGFPEVEIHGADNNGNVVAVFDTKTTGDMESLVKALSKLEDIYHVGLTFLNAEDEAERIASGEFVPEVFGRRKHEKEAE